MLFRKSLHIQIKNIEAKTFKCFSLYVLHNLSKFSEISSEMHMKDERLSDPLKSEDDISIVNADSITPTSWHDLSWVFIGVRGGFFLWVSTEPISYVIARPMSTNTLSTFSLKKRDNLT